MVQNYCCLSKSADKVTSEQGCGLIFFSNLRDNFWFNAIRRRRPVAALIFCTRLTESDCHTISHMYGLITLVIYTQVAHAISSSTPLGFLTNMGEKHKSTSPSAIQEKIWQKPISIVGQVA